MNQDEKDAMKLMIPIIRRVVPKMVLSDITGVQPLMPTKEDLWKMCLAVEIGKTRVLSKA